jgi:hypothetical protein
VKASEHRSRYGADVSLAFGDRSMPSHPVRGAYVELDSVTRNIPVLLRRLVVAIYLQESSDKTFKQVSPGVVDGSVCLTFGEDEHYRIR